jgi:hypothetical protein
VGELHVEPADIRLGHDRKRVLLTEHGATRAVGTASEILSIADERGVPSLRRVHTLDSRELGMVRVEVLMSPTTFAPLRSQSAGLLGTSSLAYDAAGVHGSVSDPDGAPTAVAELLERPVFDAHAVEVILRSLPLAPGYAVQIPAYLTHARAVVAVGVQVEALAECAGEPAWRVAVDFGHLRCTYWISAATHAVLRQDVPLSDSATLSFVR